MLVTRCKITPYSLQNSLVTCCRSGVTFCNFMKKKFHHRCFPVNFCKTLRRPILWKIKVRLLLKIKSKYQQTFYSFLRQVFHFGLTSAWLNCSCIVWLNLIKHTETAAHRSSLEQLLWKTLKCFRKTPVAEACKFSEGFV